MMEIKNLTPQTLGEKEYAEEARIFRLARDRRLSVRRHAGSHRRASSPPRAAAGIRGIAFSMVNYLDELPFFRDEVLPRLQRMGVRAKN